jgi:signal peptidase I
MEPPVHPDTNGEKRPDETALPGEPQGGAVAPVVQGLPPVEPVTEPAPRMIPQSSKDTGRLPVVAGVPVPAPIGLDAGGHADAPLELDASPVAAKPVAAGAAPPKLPPGVPPKDEAGDRHPGRRTDSLKDGEKKRKRKKRGFFGYVRDTFIELCKILLIVLLLRAYVVQASSVDGMSMEPTLHHGDYLLVERLTISLSNMPDAVKSLLPESWIPRVSAGDIVVLSSPENGNNELVKRVIATGGDHLFFWRGQVYVNGVKQPEEYLSEKWKEQLGQDSDGEFRHFDQNELGGMGGSGPLPAEYLPSDSVVERARREGTIAKLGVLVPAECLFVMGDNRLPGKSNDSRAWSRTQVPGSPAAAHGGSPALSHLWAAARSVHGRVLMRLKAPWDYDHEHPVFPK